jgi:hypothetical protein
MTVALDRPRGISCPEIMTESKRYQTDEKHHSWAPIWWLKLRRQIPLSFVPKHSVDGS